MQLAATSTIVVLLVVMAAGPVQTAPARPTDDATPSHGTAGRERCPFGDQGMGPATMTRGMLGHLQELSLSPAQQQAIRDLAGRYQVRGQDLAQRAADIREQMLGVAPDDPRYADATSRSAEAAAALAADAVKLASELRAEIHALLTAEQRERLSERARAKRQRWDDWRERHSLPQ